MTGSFDHQTQTCCLVAGVLAIIMAAQPYSTPAQRATQSATETDAAISQGIRNQATAQPTDEVPAATARLASARLGELRATYRRASVIADSRRRVERLRKLILAIETDLHGVDHAELPAWLLLLQTAYAKAGRESDAVRAMQRRYDLLFEAQRLSGLADQAYHEAVTATFQDEFELAAALFDVAEVHSADESSLFRAILDRGRLLARQSGSESAVAYYRHVEQSYRDTIPELAHEALYQIAQQYYRCKDLDHAIAVLDLIQNKYPDAEIAEKARHTIKGWNAARAP